MSRYDDVAAAAGVGCCQAKHTNGHTGDSIHVLASDSRSAVSTCSCSKRMTASPRGMRNDGSGDTSERHG
jgi:hypothetical protein